MFCHKANLENNVMDCGTNTKNKLGHGDDDLCCQCGGNDQNEACLSLHKKMDKKAAYSSIKC